MEKNICLRCRNQGHRVRDCKFLPAQRPLSTNRGSISNHIRINPSLALPEEEDVYEKDSSEDESGKE
jgi:hypothetical protein